MPMIEAALDYATAHGMSVHPTSSNDPKIPLLTCLVDAAGVEIPRTGGNKRASKDVAQIREWWTRWPTANIACATGAPSGVWVLDIDVKNGVSGFDTLAALTAKHGILPETWVADTPSGGRHLYFQFLPDRPLRNVVGFRPGLDVRTTGGSITLPPSRRPDGVYKWLLDPTECPLGRAPQWLIEIIDPPLPPRRPMAPLSISSTEKAARYVAAAVNAECSDLARTGSGGRNLKLFQAAANLGEFVGADLLTESQVYDVLERAAEECGLMRDTGAHSVRATIKSGIDRGALNPREVAA